LLPGREHRVALFPHDDQHPQVGHALDKTLTEHDRLEAVAENPRQPLVRDDRAQAALDSATGFVRESFAEESWIKVDLVRQHQLPDRPVTRHELRVPVGLDEELFLQPAGACLGPSNMNEYI